MQYQNLLLDFPIYYLLFHVKCAPRYIIFLNSIIIIHICDTLRLTLINLCYSNECYERKVKSIVSRNGQLKNRQKDIAKRYVN